MFVRFRGVQDAKLLEKQLNGIRYKGRLLETNLSLYERREKVYANDTTRKKERPTIKHNLRIGLRDQRTVTEVTRIQDHRAGIVTPPSSFPLASSPLPPILPQQEQENHHWCRKTTIVGETLSLDHLGHRPKLLFIIEEPTIKIKYL